MKIGKVPESVLKRSIIKQISTKRCEVLVDAAVGEDCAVIEIADDEVFVISTDPITGAATDIGALAVNACANDIATSGAEVIGIMLSVLLPEDTEESDLKLMMRDVCTECSRLGIQPIGGHTEVTNLVNKPIITATGVGKVRKNSLLNTKGAVNGDDVIVTKWIGLEGTSIIAKYKEEELNKRFAPSYVNEAKSFDRLLSVIPEAAVAVKSGVHAMHDITEGGVFGALWELAEAASVGLEIDLKAIPIKQHTIEICEIFGLNPYELISGGSMLITCPNGYDLVRVLKQEGINAAVIGKVTDSNDRVILNGEDRRFLEPSKPDEIYKIYGTTKLQFYSEQSS